MYPWLHGGGRNENYSGCQRQAPALPAFCCFNSSCGAEEMILAGAKPPQWGGKEGGTPHFVFSALSHNDKGVEKKNESNFLL